MAANILEALEEAAASRGATRIVLGSSGDQMSLADVLDSSKCAAAALRSRGIQQGDRVGLIVENGIGFFRGLFAIMYAGGVAVPLALPSAIGGMDIYLTHLKRVVNDAGIQNIVVAPRIKRALVTTSSAADLVAGDFIQEDELPGSGAHLSDPSGNGSLALLQYTSGSTSSPKGVMLTHQNVVAGIEAIRRASAVEETDVLGLWLPLFHDMGVFSALTCLTAGGDVILWRPSSFVRQPSNWLAEFVENRCTLCAAPNFFYDYLVEAVDPKVHQPDLSHWRLAYNGAEPVNARTIDAFCGNFSEYGFRRNAMFPVYGMAEATLAVAFPVLGADPHILWVDRKALTSSGQAVQIAESATGAMPLVSVGYAVPGVRLRIAGSYQAEGAVGEIEITGASVTGGYFRRPPGEYFTADGWLRTGDMGFVKSGELYVVGRSKDVIVVRGTNYFAEDVEAIVRELAGVFHRRCAAVSAPDRDGEHLAVVVETSLEEAGARDSLRRRIITEILENLALVDVSVVLVAPRSLPQTSSGKIQRSRVHADLAFKRADRTADQAGR